MYEADDPRSRLASAGSGAKAASAFGTATYARFYEEAPREQDGTQRTWYVRGQNFVVAYTEARDGAVLERSAQPDEYVLLLPETGAGVLLRSDAGRIRGALQRHIDERQQACIFPVCGIVGAGAIG